MNLQQERLDQLQRENRRQAIAPMTRMKALIGDNGGRVYVAGFNGNRVYVRLASGTDGGNQTQYRQVAIARVTGAPYFDYPDSPVIVSYDDEGNLIIAGTDHVRAEQAGLSLPALNVGSSQTRYVDLSKALIGYTAPVSNGVNASFRVGVNPIIADVDNAYRVFVGTPTQASKPDLTAWIPNAGNHRVVQIWLDTYHNTTQVSGSVTQGIATVLDNSDVVEAWTARFGDWIPLQSLKLANAQQTITVSDMWRDHRQWLDMPQLVGTRHKLNCNTRLWDNRQMQVQGIFNADSYMMVVESDSMVIVN